MYTIKNTTGGCGAKTPIPPGNPGDVLYLVSSGVAAASANHYWDNTNGRLGIGLTTPVAALDVYSSQATARMARFNNTKNDGGSQDVCFIHTDQSFNNAVWSGSALTVTTYPSNGTYGRNRSGRVERRDGTNGLYRGMIETPLFKPAL